MVRGQLHRLGMVGAILIASALIFGAIAGGVVVHRLQATPTASSEHQKGAQAGQQRQSTSNKNHANPEHQNEATEDQ